MIPAASSVIGNHLLAALPPRERDALRQLGRLVALGQDDVIGEPGRRVRHVYFPTRAFVALMVGMDGRDALAVDLVGSEGMIGVPLVLGLQRSPLRARVQGPGEALRIDAADFQRMLGAAPLVERQMRRYVGARLAQFARTAACASFHRVEARLACWLLMAHDRAHGDRFNLTHERLARMLGVRRSGVSTVAGLLQGRGLVQYSRGHIAILDRPALEAAACGCYRAERGYARPPAPRVEPVAAAPPPGAEVPLLLRVSPHRH